MYVIVIVLRENEGGFMECQLFSTFSLLTNFQRARVVAQLFRVDTTPFDSSLRCVKGDRAWLHSLFLLVLLICFKTSKWATYFFFCETRKQQQNTNLSNEKIVNNELEKRFVSLGEKNLMSTTKIPIVGKPNKQQ